MEPPPNTTLRLYRHPVEPPIFFKARAANSVGQRFHPIPTVPKMVTGPNPKGSTNPQKTPKGAAKGLVRQFGRSQENKGFSQPQPGPTSQYGKNDQFMQLASIPKFGRDKVPILTKHLPYNDLTLDCFTHSKLVWVDSQRSGHPPAITDPLSYTDHILREVSAEFLLGVDIPCLRMLQIP